MREGYFINIAIDTGRALVTLHRYTVESMCVSVPRPSTSASAKLDASTIAEEEKAKLRQ